MYVGCMVVLHTIKGYFYACDKFMQICQNRPLDKFSFMCSSDLRGVTHGVIKTYAVQIYATGA